MISVAAAAIDLNARTMYVTDGPPASQIPAVPRCTRRIRKPPDNTNREEHMPNISTWPNGAQCAVMFTFDFDAETLWISRDPSNWKRPGTLSQGTYGGKVGVPKILELLRDFGLKATFFVPGWTAEKYQDRLEAMLSDNHEIGHHGYLHEWIDPDFPDREREALEKGLEALKKTVGVRPSGYRSPAGETSENMVGLLAEYEFLYDSSLQDDINPYQLRLAGGAGPHRTALALEPGRRALYAVFLEESRGRS